MKPDDPTVTDEVLLTERIGHVLVLTLNRPQARNALNPELKDAILQAMAEADGDPGIRAVVVTGNGPVFCAGMPEVKRGLFAAGGGTTVATRIPLAVAKKLNRERRWADAGETAAIFRSADAMEGARAFAERRPPAWTGK